MKPYDNLLQIKKSSIQRPSWLDQDGYIKVTRRSYALSRAFASRFETAFAFRFETRSRQLKRRMQRRKRTRLKAFAKR